MSTHYGAFKRCNEDNARVYFLDHGLLTLYGAMQEFKLLTSNYQAEYGRSGGGAIQIVTRSGTSQFHGTGYYFHRHEQFNANSFSIWSTVFTLLKPGEEIVICINGYFGEDVSQPLSTALSKLVSSEGAHVLSF